MSRRMVVVVEYALDPGDGRPLPELAAEVGEVVRRRLIEEPVPGVEHRATWAAMGRRAFEVLELMPP